MATPIYSKYDIRNALGPPQTPAEKAKYKLPPVVDGQVQFPETPDDANVQGPRPVHNAIRAFDNTTLIHPFNTLVQAAHGAANVVGAHSLAHHIQPIPDYPTDPGSPAAVGGNIAGWLLPGAGIAKGAELGLDALRVASPLIEKGASKIPALVGRLGKAIGVGGATGAVTSAPNRRTRGAIGGAAGAGVGEGIVQPVLSSVGGNIFNAAKYANFRNTFLSDKPKNISGAAQRDAVNDILDNYQGARSQSNKLYSNIFDKFENSGVGMQESDMPNWQKQITKDKGGNVRPAIDKTDLPYLKSHRGVGALTSSAIWKPSSRIYDPQQFHFGAAQMRQAAGKGKTGDLVSQQAARQSGRYAKAMQTDLNNFLQKHGELDNYNIAKGNWKENVLPYLQSSLFQKHILPNMENKSSDAQNIEGLETTPSTISSMKATAPISKIATKLLPAGNESTDNALSDFTNLLGGDRQNAINHTRNLLFAKHYNDNDEFDIDGLTKSLERLKDENRHAILSPHEQQQLSDLKALKTRNMSPWRRAAIAASLGATAGHAIHPGAGMGIGAVGGMTAEHILHPAFVSLSESTPARVAQRYLAAPLGKAGKLVAPITSQELSQSNLKNTRLEGLP